MTLVAAGMMLGLAGSVHCIAMCGPLAMTLHGARDTRAATIYHAGRVLMYVAAGALAGLAGRAVSMAGLGRALSIAAGVLLIAMAVARLRPGLISTGGGAGLTRALARAMRGLRDLSLTRPRAGVLAAGALNALLPCGLLYAALAAAAALASAADAALFMTAFGAATAPALIALPLLAGAMPLAWRARLRFAAPAALAIVGVGTLVRGLGG